MVQQTTSLLSGRSHSFLIISGHRRVTPHSWVPLACCKSHQHRGLSPWTWKSRVLPEGAETDTCLAATRSCIIHDDCWTTQSSWVWVVVPNKRSRREIMMSVLSLVRWKSKWWLLGMIRKKVWEETFCSIMFQDTSLVGKSASRRQRRTASRRHTCTPTLSWSVSVSLLHVN